MLYSGYAPRCIAYGSAARVVASFSKQTSGIQGVNSIHMSISLGIVCNLSQKPK